jgi:hypothetical protein
MNVTASAEQRRVFLEGALQDDVQRRDDQLPPALGAADRLQDRFLHQRLA